MNISIACTALCAPISVLIMKYEYNQHSSHLFISRIRAIEKLISSHSSIERNNESDNGNFMKYLQKVCSNYIVIC